MSKLHREELSPEMHKFVYLATPYSHESKAVRYERFRMACEYADYLLGMGFHVYSPIAHTHPIAEAGATPTHYEVWRAMDEDMISRLDALVVCKMDGWDMSVGVQAEIEYAISIGKPVYYMGAEPYGQPYKVL